MMKRPTDDITNRRLQQENVSKPFSYVFPQMPPGFGDVVPLRKRYS